MTYLLWIGVAGGLLFLSWVLGRYIYSAYDCWRCGVPGWVKYRSYGLTPPPAMLQEEREWRRARREKQERKRRRKETRIRFFRKLFFFTGGSGGDS